MRNFFINTVAQSNVNKILVLLTQMPILQGLFYVLQIKKDLAELNLQGLNLIFNFAYRLLKGIAPKQNLNSNYLLLIAA